MQKVTFPGPLRSQGLLEHAQLVFTSVMTRYTNIRASISGADPIAYDADLRAEITAHPLPVCWWDQSTESL